MSEQLNKQKGIERTKSTKLNIKDNASKEIAKEKLFKDIQRTKNSRFFARRYSSMPNQKRYIDTCYSIMPKGKIPPLTKEQQHYYSKAYLAKMSFSEKVHKQDPKDFSGNMFNNFSAREMIIKSVDNFVAMSKQPQQPPRCTHFIDTLDKVFDNFDKVVFETRNVMKSLIETHNSSIDARIHYLNDRFADFDKAFGDYKKIQREIAK